MQFPGPVRAVVGLLAGVADEAKHLPDRAIELPMLAVSTALQASLRAQQRYARLAARGDEVLNRRRPSDDAPPWATFDEPVSVDELGRGSVSSEQAQAASDLLEELLGPAEPAGPAPVKKASPAAAETAPAKKAPVGRAPAVKASAVKATAGKAPAVKAAAVKAAAKKAPAKRAADAGRGKNVTKPRNGAPSRFDAVGDAPDD